MPSLSPQESRQPGSMSSIDQENAIVIAHLIEELQAMQTNNQHLQAELRSIKQHLEERDRSAIPTRRVYITSETERDYSTPIRLSFSSLKLLFLFLIGLAIAGVVSASLQAHPALQALTSLTPMIIPPLIVLILCVVVVSVILESLR